METPLDLSRDIKLLENVIADYREAKTERGKAILAILKDRLKRMNEGTGFTRGFTHVSPIEVNDYLSRLEI